jgi:hypothetical protein
MDTINGYLTACPFRYMLFSVYYPGLTLVSPLENESEFEIVRQLNVDTGKWPIFTSIVHDYSYQT